MAKLCAKAVWPSYVPKLFGQAVYQSCVAKLRTKKLCGQAEAKAEVRYRELHEGAVWEPFDRRPVSLKFHNASSPTDSVSGDLGAGCVP